MGSQEAFGVDHTLSSTQQNGPSKPWIIQKFGGTSIGKFAERIVDELARADFSSYQIAVVCSARSSSTKAAGTTNRLLRAVREIGHSDPRRYETVVDSIRDDHLQAIQSYVRSPHIADVASEIVLRECEDLTTFLAAVQRIGEISSKSIGRIVSKGEILSAQLMAALLVDRGIDSQFVDLSNIIDFSTNDNLDQGFYDRLAVCMKHRIDQCKGIPVMTGFFGVVPGGLLNQIGRGYTDLCAALIAVGLRAQELQIWKEVDGIFTADPRKVPTARLLSQITPAEAAELTFYGSEVIHPFTMEQVIRAAIPIRIKNVMNPHNPGTIITSDFSAPGDELTTFRKRGASLSLENQGLKQPTAVTIKHNIIVINIHSNKRSLSHGFFAKIFSVLDKWRLSIDLISTSEVHISMALHSETSLAIGEGDEESQITGHNLQGAIDDLKGYGTVDTIDGMAILSLVGKQMKHTMGIAGKMFSTLGENDVNIEMISQGASEINISCVIRERDADRAIKILHKNLFTFPD